MKFSVYSASMPEYNIQDTARLLKELGYDAVEWRVDHSPAAGEHSDQDYARRYWTRNLSTVDIDSIEESAAAIGRICGDAGLAICSLTTSLSIGNLPAIERVMKAANQLGVRNIRVNAPVYDEKENYRTLLRRTAEAIRALEHLAGRYDVRVNLETHMGNIIPSASAAYRLLADFDPAHFGVIFDPGNMVYEGYENYRLGIELLGEYLAHVHVKNAKWILLETRGNGIEVWKPDWAPFKKGFADIGKLIQVLKDVRYDGYVSVEDFSNSEDTYTKLKNNIAYLRELDGQTVAKPG